MSADLLRDLAKQTMIADREVGKAILGWAVLPVRRLRQSELSAVLTRDVETNPFHMAITYCGESRDFSDLQFRLELTRCVTGWQDRID